MGLRNQLNNSLKEHQHLAKWGALVFAGLSVAGVKFTTVADWIVIKPLNWFLSVKDGLSQKGVAVPEAAAWLIAITGLLFPMYFVYQNIGKIVKIAKFLIDFAWSLTGKEDE